MTTYIWCEDTASGYEFWCKFFEAIEPDAVVESKGNNSGLRRAVEKIDNSDNKYIIMVDHAIDNPDVLRELRRLYRLAEDKSNITIVKIFSFELILLSFSLLEQWVFAEKDALKDKRSNLLKNKDIFVKAVTQNGNAEDLVLLRKSIGYSDKYNTELIAAKMLYDITRNTGFETDKKHLGLCFYIDCCKWEERQSDDICGLDKNRLEMVTKMVLIMEHSILKKAFEGVRI